MKRPVKFIFLFLCLQISKYSFSQTTSTKGSFIIAAICRDGIIMGADSRLTFLQNNVPMGHMDSIQKVFVGKNFIIGLMGLANLKDSTISYLTNKFADTVDFDPSHPFLDIAFLWNENVVQYFNGYQNAAPYLDKIEIFAAFYKNKTPGIHYIKKDMVYLYRKGFIARDTTLFNSVYKPNMTCRQAKKWIEKAIYQYAIDKNLTNYIGGPIFFVKISKKNKAKWIGAMPPKEYKSLQELSNEKEKINPNNKHLP